MSLFDLFKFDMKPPNFSHKSKEELLALDDEEFYLAMRRLYFNPVFSLSECKNRVHRTYYIVMGFYTEAYHEGVSQFFYGSYRECAPYVSDALKEVGSIKMRYAFDELVKAAQIPLDDSDALQNLEEDENADELMMQFDNSFYENDDVNECLVAYARAYIDDLMITQ